MDHGVIQFPIPVHVCLVSVNPREQDATGGQRIIGDLRYWQGERLSGDGIWPGAFASFSGPHGSDRDQQTDDVS